MSNCVIQTKQLKNQKHTGRWKVVYTKMGVKEINRDGMNRYKLAHYKI